MRRVCLWALYFLLAIYVQPTVTALNGTCNDDQHVYIHPYNRTVECRPCADMCDHAKTLGILGFCVAHCKRYGPYLRKGEDISAHCDSNSEKFALSKNGPCFSCHYVRALNGQWLLDIIPACKKEKKNLTTYVSPLALIIISTLSVAAGLLVVFVIMGFCFKFIPIKRQRTSSDCERSQSIPLQGPIIDGPPSTEPSLSTGYEEVSPQIVDDVSGVNMPSAAQSHPGPSLPPMSSPPLDREPIMPPTRSSPEISEPLVPLDDHASHPVSYSEHPFSIEVTEYPAHQANRYEDYGTASANTPEPYETTVKELHSIDRTN